MGDGPKAILSVTDKRGIVEFSRGLHSLGYDIISTSGTAAVLQGAGIPITSIEEFTGQGEILGGRVKTLHPRIYAGILADRGSDEHQRALEGIGADPIALVAVNLYDLEDPRARMAEEGFFEQIDIGGVTLLRAAAKNFSQVTVVCDPADYGWVFERLAQGGLPRGDRRRLALKAFAMTSRYEAQIYNRLSSLSENPGLPADLRLAQDASFSLRYGENPHQSGASYRDPQYLGPSIPKAEKLHGKELSYNNLLDLDGVLGLLMEFESPTGVVVKHTNPSGIACAATILEAFQTAYAADPLSAYGGVAGVNRPVDRLLAEEISSRFFDCVLAPDYSEEALALLKKKKNLRILRLPSPWSPGPPTSMHWIRGGTLVQTTAFPPLDPYRLNCVTRVTPTEAQIRSFLFAAKVTRHVRSNSIILVKGERTVGIGAGQMSRVDAAWIAGRKAGPEAQGSVLASDAFFPFRDGVDEAAKVGVKAILQPGGSVRDPEVIAAADEHGIAMVFSGIRMFLH